MEEMERKGKEMKGRGKGEGEGNGNRGVCVTGFRGIDAPCFYLFPRLFDDDLSVSGRV